MQDIYKKILGLLKSYFNCNNWENLFLNGGCYWLANFLHDRISETYLVINRVDEHCALSISGKVYDVTGEISGRNFHRASDREISFMKKNYKPKFDVVELSDFLIKNI